MIIHRHLRSLFAGALALALVSIQQSSARAQDPGTPGPLAVSADDYTDGNTAFTPPGFPGPVEFTGTVFSPTDLSGGPFPVIVILHGRHSTCFSGPSATLQWPCPASSMPINSYRGYDYVARNLASYGFIVISISANGINARDNNVTDLGMLARAQLIQAHLDRWNTYNTTGGMPFGTRFIGRLDLNNVGTMGHSRGGEGVVRHYVYNDSLGAPYTINAVLPLAPVDFSRPIANNTALEVILPYCDGDVSDLQGIHFFDDARYNVPGDYLPKFTLLLKGANHNFFNTVWTPGIGPAGAADDWTQFVGGGSSDPWCGTVPGNHRLTAAQQRDALNAYMTAFFRGYLKADFTTTPYLSGDLDPPPSVAGLDLHASYHAVDDPTIRRDVNRLLTTANLTSNTLGGAVSASGFTPGDLCGGASPQPQHCLPGQSTTRQPHTTPSARAGTVRGLSQLRGGWTAATATFTNQIPATMCGAASCRDVSGFDSVQFRVSVNFADSRNPAGAGTDFSVVLTDASGASSSLSVASNSNALYFPPGTVLPKILLNTVRLPLTSFTGVDYTAIQSVQFVFDQASSGAILVSDLAFANAP